MERWLVAGLPGKNVCSVEGKKCVYTFAKQSKFHNDKVNLGGLSLSLFLSFCVLSPQFKASLMYETSSS